MSTPFSFSQSVSESEWAGPDRQASVAAAEPAPRPAPPTPLSRPRQGTGCPRWAAPGCARAVLGRALPHLSHTSVRLGRACHHAATATTTTLSVTTCLCLVVHRAVLSRRAEPPVPPAGRAETAAHPITSLCRTPSRSARRATAPSTAGTSSRWCSPSAARPVFLFVLTTDVS